MFTRISNSLIILLALTLCFQANAAKVVQAKNGKVLIDLEGETASPNQNAVLINADNKRVAIVQISQVKNGKAIGTVTKGQAQGNEKVTLIVPKSGGDTASADSSGGGNQVYRTSSKKMSVVLSLMSNSMTTKQSDGAQPTPTTEDVSMKGSTFGVTGAVDWPFTSSLVLRGTLGYEPFKTTGTATTNMCDNLTSTNCTADITYLSAGGYARFDFNKSRTQFWAALGGTFKFPMSKSTTALKQDDIKMTMTYGAAGGMDFFLSNKTFIPVSLEQQFFLKSDTVSASIMMIRVGYGQAF